MHGVSVIDPYRWLEDQGSPSTRRWLEQQTQYARAYLDYIPGRDSIRKRIRELLAVETYDSLQKAGNRYFFLKRLPDQDQPCICMREGPDGDDYLLLDPARTELANILRSSPFVCRQTEYCCSTKSKKAENAQELLHFWISKAAAHFQTLLPRGLLARFCICAGWKKFLLCPRAFVCREAIPLRAAYRHVLASDFDEDQEIFCAGEDKLPTCL